MLFLQFRPFYCDHNYYDYNKITPTTGGGEVIFKFLGINASYTIF